MKAEKGTAAVAEAHRPKGFRRRPLGLCRTSPVSPTGGGLVEGCGFLPQRQPMIGAVSSPRPASAGGPPNRLRGALGTTRPTFAGGRASVGMSLRAALHLAAATAL